MANAQIACVGDATMTTQERVIPQRQKPERDDIGIQPRGRIVEIYVAKSYRGIPVGDVVFPVNINGFTYKVPAGRRCQVPYEVYAILKNARSRQAPVDMRQAERLADLGRRRLKGDTIEGESATHEMTICDYEVELIRDISKG